jgi:hypothetical protein
MSKSTSRGKCDVSVKSIQGSDQIEDAKCSRGPIYDCRYCEAIQDTKLNMLMLMLMLRCKGCDNTK